jgi:hypothetical protein
MEARINCILSPLPCYKIEVPNSVTYIYWKYVLWCEIKTLYCGCHIIEHRIKEVGLWELTINHLRPIYRKSMFQCL